MILILMATYNGENYIQEQIDSILRQSHQDFLLRIRDDCSEDGTWPILQYYAKAYPNKICVEQTQTNSGGAKFNFLHQMSQCQEDYIMLCDQDDLWHRDKIRDTWLVMKQEEKKHTEDCPLLIHTDLTVVDETLHILDKSLENRVRADFSRNELHQLIVQNTVAGCSTMYNGALAKKLKQPASFYVMHDWWLALTASAFGRIVYVKEPTALYRQHKENVMGAKNAGSLQYKIKRFLEGEEVRSALEGTYRQAESFLEAYKEELSPSQKELLFAYSKIPTKNKCHKIGTVCRLKTWKHGPTRKIGQLIFL